MESLQRKHQGQLSASRRGLPTGEEGKGQGQGQGRGQGGASVNTAQEGAHQVHQAEKRELLSRIALLEEEVIRTAEELGRMRALNVATATATITADNSNSNSTSSSNSRQDDACASPPHAKDTERDDEEVQELREENAKYRLDIKRLQREMRAQEKQLSQLIAENDSSDGDDDRRATTVGGDT